MDAHNPYTQDTLKRSREFLNFFEVMEKVGEVELFQEEDPTGRTDPMGTQLIR